MPIVKLNCQKKNVLKYSVKTAHSVEFVNIFRSDVNEKIYVCCQSGLCQQKFGKLRNLVNLKETTNSCDHMVAFKDFGNDPEVINLFEQIGSDDEEENEGVHLSDDDSNENENDNNEEEEELDTNLITEKVCSFLIFNK